MINESQSQHAGVVAVHPRPITDGAVCPDTHEETCPATPEPTSERGEAWVSMEVYARQQASICQLEEEVKRLGAVVGLLLELCHQIVIDMHSPKAHWDRELIPIWKEHIQAKRKQEPT